jgi:hypothetical protein
MKVLLTLAIAFLPTMTSAGGPQEKKGPAKDPAVKDESLRKELLAMLKEDQQARTAMLKEMGEKGLSPLKGKTTDPRLQKLLAEIQRKWAEVDTKNRLRLEKIVDKCGWPGKSLVGKDGAHAAFVLVQHADQQRAFQKRCLKLMKAAPKGEVEPQDIAYLTDRVLVGEKKKQRYGTQLEGKDGVFKALPIEDDKNVDKRRAAVGLPPLAEYLKTAQQFYEQASGKSPDKKKDVGKK